MNDPRTNPLPPYVWRLLLAAAVVAAALLAGSQAQAVDTGVAQVTYQRTPASWVFARSRYSHDPTTGARVGQFAQVDPVEPLPDPRDVTSGYSRTRTVLRGPDGGVNTTYRVQSFGNGRGGLDAEFERFHDAWRGSTIDGSGFQGNFQQQFFPFGGFAPGYGGGYGGGYGHHGFPEDDPRFRFDRRRFGPRGLNSEGFNRGLDNPANGRIDPDGADGFRDGRRRTPDRDFFPPGFRPGVESFLFRPDRLEERD